MLAEVWTAKSVSLVSDLEPLAYDTEGISINQSINQPINICMSVVI